MIVPTPDEGNITISVRVIPRSSRNEISGLVGDAIKVKLTAPPVEGAANEHLIRFLAKSLDINRARIRIASGERSREKLVAFSGLTVAEMERLKTLLRPGD